MRNGGRLSDLTTGISELFTWQVDLLKQITNALNNYYCLPDKYSESESSLVHQLIHILKELNSSTITSSSTKPNTEGDYKAYIDKVNEVLQKFDPHLELKYNPKFIEEMKHGNHIISTENSAKFDLSGGPPKEEVEKWNKYEEENPTFRNFGFVNYQGPSGVIPDNIGYVNISHLIDPQLGAGETVDKFRMGPNAVKRLHEVMKELSAKDAIILDLSVTPYGGSPEMVQHIVSFFMPTNTPINTIHDRLNGCVTSYHAIETPLKILDKPVALLAGPNTFSGREEALYDLQQYNTTLKESRFTVIGQPTKGGAHPEATFPLIQAGELNNSLILSIPYACSINPVSKSNWEDHEKKGVQPDIIVESDKALSIAVRHLECALSNKSGAVLTLNAQMHRELHITHQSTAHLLREFDINPSTPAESNSDALKRLFLEDEADRAKLWCQFNRISPVEFEVQNRLLGERDQERRQMAMVYIERINNPTSMDYYHAAILFQHGNTVADYQKAHHFAEASYKLGHYKPDNIEMCDNKYLMATTYDRLQDSMGLPQKYGTQSWAPNHPDVSKRGALVHPPGCSEPDIVQIEAARLELGIESLKSERASRGQPTLSEEQSTLPVQVGKNNNFLK